MNPNQIAIALSTTNTPRPTQRLMNAPMTISAQ